uniref:Uncharacterized protein n=1 Tax=Aureoumbra lagunensis TaxID=44058 RepID=A0A7S3JR87_9STRA|mmetsp:Transcript_13245/g.19812  ORF Transcript_13245/g.19812 Transcript_13245/m.19812 type:complete len:802 (+) Transcript_13245:79-2484(+)|eukprot:CAMPEP_0197325132 /NCGR_PEP_ID=MMETSP0891-20130614/71503_1 /TAXON_ID=44058 ORGANISM="Aureoumbra lagunensis, Strain CCMP1510" /NCGR_SAMPLE_ID=MMETSP0891 /ASSEMBLY_ACC=CAM_ASM_000534 /LENGTH=801 /DNA_ID=CAMNT_0042818049 /DNA_START=45 /DNA_END=2450 /DNA_ORIENTATION=+
MAAVHNHSVSASLDRELHEIGGAFEIKVTVGDGVGRSYRRQVSPGRVAALERSLKSEIGIEIVTAVTGMEIETRLKEYARTKHGEAAAQAVESWLSAAAASIKTRRTASFRGFFEENQDNALVEEEFDEEVSTASFLLMGAPFRYASLGESPRLAARLSVYRDETVAWNWTTTGHPGSSHINFRALFVDRDNLKMNDDNKQQDNIPFEFPAVIDDDLSILLATSGNTHKAKLVQQDNDHRTWLAPDDGFLLLVWESEAVYTAEELLALKIAKCNKETAEAARAAAKDSRAAREEGTFGERVFRAPEEALINVKLVFQRTNRSKSITGLHVRERLRKAAAKLADTVQQNHDHEHIQRTSSQGGSDNKSADEIARSLELAAQRLSTLEDEAAAANARADRFQATAELERRSNEADRQAWARERIEISARLETAENNGARLTAKVNCARTALSALLEHELSAFVPPQRKENESLGETTVLSKDDRILLDLLEEKSHNPFIGSSADPQADRDWSRAACGDETFDSIAIATRLAAERAAAACDRARANIVKLEKDKARYQHEKRVLVAELKRLRSTSDSRLAAATAEAQEARMVQREINARYDRLRKNYASLTRRLAKCTCGAVLPHDDDDDTDHTIEDQTQQIDMEEGTPGESKHAVQGIQQYDHSLSSPPRPSKDIQQNLAYRSKLVAKLDSCRQRQQMLQKLLDEQPEQSTHFKPLKSKLDSVISSLEAQITNLDGDGGRREIAFSRSPSSDNNKNNNHERKNKDALSKKSNVRSPQKQEQPPPSSSSSLAAAAVSQEGMVTL